MIKKVGDVAVLDCVFPPDHNNTHWTLPDVLQDSTISTLAPNSVLLSFSVTDLLHEANILCQASTPKGYHVYKHYMLITYGKLVTRVLHVDLCDS